MDYHIEGGRLFSHIIKYDYIWYYIICAGFRRDAL